MKRRILLLSYGFPPMALPEAILATKRMGNIPDAEVDVVCAPPLRAWMGDDHSLDGYVDSHFASVKRVPPSLVARHAPLGRLQRTASMPDMLRVLNGRLHRVARRRIATTRYDALVTWSTWHSVHLVGRRLRAETGLPWLAHFSDPWTANPFVAVSDRVRGANERMERAVLGSADRLLYTSDETVDLVAATFGDDVRAKARVVPHAFDPALYPAPVARAGDGAPIVARYLGRFYGPRTPAPLLAGLARLRETDPAAAGRLRIEIVGEVGEGMLDTAVARSLPPGTVRVVPPVDYVPSLRLAVEADLLLVVDAPASTSVFLPSKLVDYLGAGRPIVCISPPGAASSLTASIGGRVADLSDTDAVAAALRRALDGAPAPDDRGGPVRARYTVATVGQQVSAILDEVAGAGASRR